MKKHIIALAVAALVIAAGVVKPLTARANSAVVKAAIRQVFGTGHAGRIATCIAWWESAWHSYAVSPPNYDGSRDYGEMQINSSHFGRTLRTRVGSIYVSRRLILQPVYNAKVAYVLSNGGRDFGPWTTSGHCR